MSKGKTFSITVPLPLFEQLEQEAKEQGISRSKRVYNILQKYYSQPLQLESPDKLIKRCARESEHGICSFYEVECPIKNALTQRSCDQFEDPEIIEDIHNLKGK